MIDSYLDSPNYNLLKIPPQLEVSQDLAIVCNDALNMALQILFATSKHYHKLSSTIATTQKKKNTYAHFVTLHSTYQATLRFLATYHYYSQVSSYLSLTFKFNITQLKISLSKNNAQNYFPLLFKNCQGSKDVQNTLLSHVCLLILLIVLVLFTCIQMFFMFKGKSIHLEG